MIGRCRAVAAVHPQLRVPLLLLLPVHVANRPTLQVARMVSAVRATAKSVSFETYTRPATGGTPAGQMLVFRPDPPGDRSIRRPGVLWLHGGGMISGTPAESAGICAQIAAETGAVVVAPHYRLAPENPFPAALDDCRASLHWLYDQAAELGVDHDRLAIGGHSGGGGLAAALAQRARDDGGPRLGAQVLLYPMLDDRTALRTDRHQSERFVWTPRSNRFAWMCYLGHPPQSDEPRPYAAPARRTDLTGLPPAWIGVGDQDLFFAECTEYARRLSAAGVSVRLHQEQGMYHSAQLMSPAAAISKRFIRSYLDWLAAALRC